MIFPPFSFIFYIFKIHVNNSLPKRPYYSHYFTNINVSFIPTTDYSYSSPSTFISPRGRAPEGARFRPDPPLEMPPQKRQFSFLYSIPLKMSHSKTGKTQFDEYRGLPRPRVPLYPIFRFLHRCRPSSRVYHCSFFHNSIHNVHFIINTSYYGPYSSQEHPVSTWGSSSPSGPLAFGTIRSRPPSWL